MAGPLFQAVQAALRSTRLVCDTETRLQSSISEALTAAGVPFEREVRLTPKDRIDFMVEGIGIEAKIKGGRLAVWRQLERYARHQEITALILVGAIAIPAIAEIEGKPFAHVSVGSGWL